MLSCTALLVILTGITACGGASNEVLLRVGDTVVTQTTFEHWMSVAHAMRPAEVQALMPDPSGHMTLKQRILSFLITSARTIGEAHDDGISVTDTEAHAVLERIRFEQTQRLSSNGQSEPQTFLFDKAATTADRVWAVKVQTLAEKLHRRQLSAAEQLITHAQITSYYLHNKRDFIAPEQRDVAVILTHSKAAIELAKREIESGHRLSQVVERRNEEAGVGGYKRGVTQRSLTRPYENQFFSTPPHVLVGPLKGVIYYLFEVAAITPARQQRLAEVQTLIRRRLVAGPQRQVFTSIVRALEQKWRTKTRCRAGYAVAQCSSALP